MQHLHISRGRAVGAAHSGCPVVAALWLGVFGALGCDRGLSLSGERDDGAAGDDVAEDGSDLGLAEGSEADADMGGDWSGDGGDPPCPIHARSRAVEGPGDGSALLPYEGLQTAIDARGACQHVVLLHPAGDPAFDAFVDILLEPGERLVIEGDPAVPEPAQLSGDGERPGLLATGQGALVLRHLAVRDAATGFRASEEPDGACLHATLDELVVEDTEWSGCQASGNGGAVYVLAAGIESPGGLTVRSSRFDDNHGGADEERFGGAIAYDSAREDSWLVVENSFFRGNSAHSGGAIALLGLTFALRIESSRFVTNESVEGGTAVSGFAGGRIDGNRVEENSGTPGNGALFGELRSASAEVTHNLFLRNRSSPPTGACRPSAMGVGGTGLLVANNVFDANRSQRGADWTADCTSGVIGIGFYALVYNNLLLDNVGEHGLAHLTGTEVDFRNNIVAGGDGSGGGVYFFEGLPGESLVEFNASWHVPPPTFGGEPVIGAGNIETDCLLRDVVSGDFTLASDSPCIDAGDPASDLADPDGSRGDIGPFGGPLGDWIPLPAEGAP